MATLRLVLLALAFYCNAACADDFRLEWRVEQPFPLIAPDDYERLREVKERYSAKSVRDLYLALVTEQRAAAASGNPQSHLLASPRATQFDQLRQRYAHGYLRRSGDRVAAVATVVGTEKGSTCAWRVGDSQETVTQACDTPFRFLAPLDTPLQLSAAVETLTVTTSVRVRNRVVAALGDSFASGEGNPDVPASYHQPASNEFSSVHPSWIFQQSRLLGTPAAWWDRECHRSLTSWPVLAVLWLALSNADPHSRYTLLTYACSGAEIDDGVFAAQLDPPGLGGGHFADRNGDATWRFHDFDGPRRRMVELSQINALVADLCNTSSLRARLIPLSGVATRLVSVNECIGDALHPDALLLSVGGNDVAFSGIVMGVLAPDEARGVGFEKVIRRLFLSLFKRAANVVDLEDGASNATRLKQHYPDLIEKIASASSVPVNRTILVTYPNVVGTNTMGCTNSSSGNTEDSRRIRDSFMVFGNVVARTVPLAPAGWTVGINPEEVLRFQTTYRAISEMQESVRSLGVNLVPFLSPRSGEHSSAFLGRLLCDPQQRPVASTTYAASSPSGDHLDAGLPLVPRYFCMARPSRNYQDCRNLQPSAWQMHARDRRVVNTINDSLMALRTWDVSHLPVSRDQILEASKGSMHPVAEAHAEAADNVAPVLHRILSAPKHTKPWPDR